jgi:predicted PurR-regulated permease PerM
MSSPPKQNRHERDKEPAMTEKQRVEAGSESGATRPAYFMPPLSIIWLLGIALVAALVYVSRDFVLLLLLSATLAYLLNPIVKIAESALIKRHIAVTVIYLTMGFGVLSAGYFLFPRLSAEVENLSGSLPSLGERLDQAIDAVQLEIVARYPVANRLLTSREFRYEKLNGFIEQQTKNLPALVGQLASLILASVLIPFFSYFFLRDGQNILQSVLDRVPANYIETSVAIWREIDRIVGHYLRGVALEGVTLGTIAGLGLWMLGVNYPLLLGTISGVANVVPYFGPILGGGSAVLVALVQFKSLAPIAKILVLYLFLKLLDIFAIQPLAVGRGKELHPVLLIASIIIGGHALGIVGMLIAVPTFTVFQRIVQLAFESRRYSVSTSNPQRKVGVPIPPFVC